jgi:ureidoglycolate hydrolase
LANLHRSATKNPLITVTELTESAFQPFGRVIYSDQRSFTAVFEPPHSESWLVGINNVTGADIVSLHRHMSTWECFSPIHGDLYIAVVVSSASTEQIAAINVESEDHVVTVFRISQPVCVAPMTWHTLLTPTDAKAFVCENASVTGELVTLATPLEVAYHSEG